jgi:hypothetical protein
MTLRAPEYAAKLTEMWAVLEQQQKAYDDEVPLKVANPQPPVWSPPASGEKGK